MGVTVNSVSVEPHGSTMEVLTSSLNAGLLPGAEGDFALCISDDESEYGKGHLSFEFLDNANNTVSSFDLGGAIGQATWSKRKGSGGMEGPGFNSTSNAFGVIGLRGNYDQFDGAIPPDGAVKAVLRVSGTYSKDMKIMIAADDPANNYGIRFRGKGMVEVTINYTKAP